MRYTYLGIDREGRALVMEPDGLLTTMEIEPLIALGPAHTELGEASAAAQRHHDQETIRAVVLAWAESQPAPIREWAQTSVDRERRAAAADHRRAEEMGRLYRRPTAEELASAEGIRRYLARDIHRAGPAALEALLPPVIDALRDLGQTEAAGELRRALAITNGLPDDQAQLFIRLCRGFLELSTRAPTT